METIFPSQEETKPVIYAGFWIRLIAYLLDSIILCFVFGVVVLISKVFISYHLILEGEDGAEPAFTPAFYWLMFVAMIITWVYFALLESSIYQATPGKMTMNIIVTDLNGNRISFAQATGRFFAKILSNMTIYIGYILAAFTNKKQALHDMIAGTVVVRNEYTNP